MDTTISILRVALGLGLGAMVGIERQWRSRTAGLRTNALVSLGAWTVSPLASEPLFEVGR